MMAERAAFFGKLPVVFREDEMDWLDWKTVLTGATTLFSLLMNSCSEQQVKMDGAGQEGSYRAVVSAVHDGDTVRLTDTSGKQHKVRLAYIDAPELNQAFGQASRDALSKVLLRKRVEVDVFELDRYQREVARIRLNGKDINLRQVQEGNAWHYRSIAEKKQTKSDFRVYQNAERQAQADSRGLWSQRSPVAPWAFRKQQRGAKQH